MLLQSLLGLSKLPWPKMPCWCVVTGSRSASRSFDLPYSVDSISREQISDGRQVVVCGRRSPVQLL